MRAAGQAQQANTRRENDEDAHPLARRSQMRRPEPNLPLVWTPTSLAEISDQVRRLHPYEDVTSDRYSLEGIAAAAVLLKSEMKKQDAARHSF